MLVVVSAAASSSAFIHHTDTSRHRRILTKLNNGGMDAYDAQMAAMLAATKEEQQPIINIDDTTVTNTKEDSYQYDIPVSTWGQSILEARQSSLIQGPFANKERENEQFANYLQELQSTISMKRDINDNIQTPIATAASSDEEEHSSITYIEPNDELISTTEEEVSQEDLFLKMVSNEVEYKKLLNQSRKLHVCIRCVHKICKCYTISISNSYLISLLISICTNRYRMGGINSKILRQLGRWYTKE